MNLDETLAELTALPVTDRLRVVASIWDSIESDTPVHLSPEQQAELRRRVAAHQANPNELLTWDEVLDQLRARFMMELRFRPEVVDDLEATSHWYNHRQTGLGGEFLAECRGALDRIVQRPEQGAMDADGVRGVRIHRFPT